jgi:hypothetical protein
MSNSERQQMYEFEFESELRRWWHRVTGAIVVMTSSAAAWLAFQWLAAR